jgi:hypothetical protein
MASYSRSDDVVEELRQDDTFQEPGLLPWREEELESLRFALDIKGTGLL